MRRHYITSGKETIRSREMIDDTFIPIPELDIWTTNKGNDAKVFWRISYVDKPNIAYYELYLNGELFLETTKVSIIYPMTASTEYRFKIRAVGYSGKKGFYSPEKSITGGDLPPLRVIGSFYEPLGMSLAWTDVQDNQFYTIIGYNVYYHPDKDVRDLNLMTKLNDELITYTSYTKFVETPEEQYCSMAVTYTYIGSYIESQGYFVTPEALGDGVGNKPVPIKHDTKYPGGSYTIGCSLHSGRQVFSRSAEAGLVLDGSPIMYIDPRVVGAKPYVRFWSFWYKGRVSFNPRVSAKDFFIETKVSVKQGCDANDFRVEYNDLQTGTVETSFVAVGVPYAPLAYIIGGCKDKPLDLYMIEIDLIVSEGIKDDSFILKEQWDTFYIKGNNVPPPITPGDPTRFSSGRLSLSFN